jgi:hypothetical protein
VCHQLRQDMYNAPELGLWRSVNNLSSQRNVRQRTQWRRREWRRGAISKRRRRDRGLPKYIVLIITPYPWSDVPPGLHINYASSLLSLAVISLSPLIPMYSDTHTGISRSLPPPLTAPRRLPLPTQRRVSNRSYPHLNSQFLLQ